MIEISPLFVVEAEQLMLADLYQESIELCKKGLEDYPEYLTAWGILARSYEKMGDSINAVETVNTALEFFPDNKILLNLLKDLTLNLSDEEFGRIKILEIENIKDDFLKKLNDTKNEDDSLILANSSQDNAINNFFDEYELKNFEEINQNEKIIITDVDTVNEDYLFKSESNKRNEIDLVDEVVLTNQDSYDDISDEKNNLNDNIQQNENPIVTNNSKKIIIEESGKIQKAYISEDENNYSTKGFLSQFISEDKLNHTKREIKLIDGIESIKYKDLSKYSKERSAYRPPFYIPEITSFMKTNIPESQKSNNQTIEKLPDKFESNLEILAKRLEMASIPRIVEEDDYPQEDNSNYSPAIISETMANIYLAQGAYEEAAKAYKELLIRNPDRKEYFMNKLDTLIPKLK